ncbi:hypothetical protein HanXRQr2_Chr10g0435021 [Helianthus annuus]|uniref:Uncharacterized protein n=1 Tax=Helianthus annuus TaxID=4232 RepID=A0A9K3N3R8_HELAN|nr:hypothetical protein HanXRQr2_Chr10g0435021 [Helianthus annuus]
MCADIGNTQPGRRFKCRFTSTGTQKHSKWPHKDREWGSPVPDRSTPCSVVLKRINGA